MTVTFQRNELANKTEFLLHIAQADKIAARDCTSIYGTMIWALAKQATASVEALKKPCRKFSRHLGKCGFLRIGDF